MNDREVLVKKRLREDGWTVMRAGWPDFLCRRGSEVKAVEVKSPSDRASSRQKRVHRALKVAGLETEVVVQGDAAEEGVRTISVRDIDSVLWRRIKSEASLKGQTVPEFLNAAFARLLNGRK